MVINESGLRAAMQSAFKKKSTGYKVALRHLTGEDPQIVLSTSDWTVILNRENAPRKVLSQIVEHLGDLPSAGQAFHVQDNNAQAEIYKMAVPGQEELLDGVSVKRTQIAYMGHTIYQREDNCDVYMVPTKLEDLLDSKLLPLRMTADSTLYLEGIASQVYIKPYEPMQGDSKALQHFAKFRWI